ncbi:nitrilase-related carbon-nitrogen hydrolase [Prosthecobacter fluviatilis]|uniref:Nitrilase-related carbon-nitrogen hydrolase n=1 Tax=Prosthecobacter fluviatilis TaxID=445931 RepID=A0ABW0KIU5_9BACT
MITVDLCTFDPGAAAKTPAAFAAVVVDCVEASWDSGADLVLLPEFTWVGLEPLVEPRTLRRVAEVFWGEVLPAVKSLLIRPRKAVVLGTVPFWHEESQELRNRAPILVEENILFQDKLHLTPWEAEFSPGTELRLWEFGGLRFAVVICLDIEIPEISVRLRGAGVDMILVPSATETLLGVERVDRCASARAVELGCIVGVSHLTGKADAGLIDENVGRTAVYFPSQAAFREEPRWNESAVYEGGIQKQRLTLDPKRLQIMRRMPQETNPSLLKKMPAFELVVG